MASPFQDHDMIRMKMAEPDQEGASERAPHESFEPTNLFKPMYKNYIGPYLSMGNETTHFWYMRFEKDMEMVRRVVHCHTPMELFQCQWQFYNELISDYLNESARLHAVLGAPELFNPPKPKNSEK